MNQKSLDIIILIGELFDLDYYFFVPLGIIKSNPEYNKKMLKNMLKKKTFKNKNHRANPISYKPR